MTRPEARRRPQAFAAHQIADDLDEGADPFDPFAAPDDDVAPTPVANVPKRASTVPAFAALHFLGRLVRVTLPQVVAGVAVVVTTGVVVGLVRRRS